VELNQNPPAPPNQASAFRWQPSQIALVILGGIDYSNNKIVL